MENLNFQAMAAYLANDSQKLKSLAHSEMLRKEGAFGSEAHHVRIAGMKTHYILGNSRIAFDLGKASYWSDEFIGCTEILAVWVKQDRWKLLAISNDPITLETATKDIPKLAAALTEDKGGKMGPAELVTPGGVYPEPAMGQRFGDFLWKPSASPDVLVEIAEFHYGRASRLFYQPNGKVSTGQLWTTSTPWFWRVWSIGKNGQVVFSSARFFHQNAPGRPGS